MEHKPPPDTSSLKNLRVARSLSQNEVAKAIGTNANTVSRWERGIAAPSLYYRRKLATLFGVDLQELFSNLNGQTEAGGDLPHKTEDPPQTDKTTEGLPSKLETGGDLPNETEDASQGDRRRPPAWLRGRSLPSQIPQVYISVASIIIFVLILGDVFAFPPLLHKPLPDSFPPLCSGNFQSTNTSIVPTPATSISLDGEPIGLSEGATIFDLNRPNQQEVQDKLRAAQDWVNNPQDVASSLENAISSDKTDAEAQIYLENWKVLGSNHPHITYVVGVSFEANSYETSDRALQGAYTAQKECNDHNNQDNSKTQIVLTIANIGGTNPDDRASSATFVVKQIVDQASKDPTIVGIMGWPLSQDSINVNHQLKIRESHLPMVSPSASSDDLKGTSYFFRVCPLNQAEAIVAAKFLLNTQHKKKIAILYDSTTSYTNNLESDFAADISTTHIVGSEAYVGDDTKTLQEALNNALAQKPDAIFFAGYANNLAELLKNNSSTSFANLLIVGGDDLATTDVYKSPLPNPVYFATFSSPNAWDGINPQPSFFQDSRANFGTLTTPIGLPGSDENIMLSYDAMLTLLYGTQQILSRQSTISSYDLIKELKNITGINAIQGVTGRIAFDSNGDQAPGKMIFVEHIDGTSLKVDEKHGCLRVTDNCNL